MWLSWSSQSNMVLPLPSHWGTLDILIFFLNLNPSFTPWILAGCQPGGGFGGNSPPGGPPPGGPPPGGPPPPPGALCGPLGIQGIHGLLLFGGLPGGPRGGPLGSPQGGPWPGGWLSSSGLSGLFGSGIPPGNCLWLASPS